MRFTASFDLGTALQNKTDLINEINGTVFNELRSSRISGGSVDEEYLRTEAQQELQSGTLCFLVSVVLYMYGQEERGMLISFVL